MYDLAHRHVKDSSAMQCNALGDEFGDKHRGGKSGPRRKSRIMVWRTILNPLWNLVLTEITKIRIFQNLQSIVAHPTTDS